MTTEVPKYPKRPSHFANKAVRAMVKTCVANEHGPEVFTLLTVIAHTEDAAHYRRPVTFHGGQLMPLIGVMSETTFKRVRERAVASGWLVYIPGAKRKPASYFIQIPKHAQGLDDRPTDEGGEFDSYGPHSGSDSRPHSGSNLTQNPDGIRTSCDPESGLNPDLIRPPFIPNPIPYPIPIPPPTPSGGVAREKNHQSAVADVPLEPDHIREQLDAAENELIVTWNGLRGVRPFKRTALSYAQRSVLESWMFGRSRLDWREALRKFPLQCFEAGGGFQPTLNWFLDGEHAGEVLDGKYDFSLGAKPQAAAAAPRRRVRLADFEPEGGAT